MNTNIKKGKKKSGLKDNLGFSPQLTILGNCEAQLDGCGEIKEYDDGKITFSFGKINICFCGNNLVIKNYIGDYAEIFGEIASISFE